MIKDYHMHPALLCTSEQRFDQFVQQAVKMGIEEICITDHMPLSCSKAKDRIPHGRVEDYCRSVRELSQKYKNILSIKVGIEIDFHPSVTDEIENVLKCGDFDYVLGSTHLHVMENGDILKNSSGRNEYAELSFKNTIAAARSGYFDAIAHLDMFKAIFSQPKRYPLTDDGYCEKKHIELLHQTLDAIKDNGLRLELNPHFASSEFVDPDNRLDSMYPSPSIVQMALDKNMRFSFGSDAHSPEQVGELLPQLRMHPVFGKAISKWENE